MCQVLKVNCRVQENAVFSINRDQEYMQMIRYNSLLTVLFMVLLCFAKEQVQHSPVTIAQFFDDSFTSGGNAYVYGGRTGFVVKSDNEKRYGSVLVVQFDDKAVSAGIGVGLAENSVAACKKVIDEAALRFRVKGGQGNERILVGLLDNGSSGNGDDKVTARCRLSDWCTIGKEWQTVTIPLSAFTGSATRWLEKTRANEIAKINWDGIGTVLFATEKEGNIGCSGEERIAILYFDNIELIHTEAAGLPQPKFAAWGLRSCTPMGPKVESGDISSFYTWWGSAVAPGTAVYTYGSPTDYQFCSSSDTGVFPVFTAYLNDNEWSGVTFYRPDNQSINIRAIRETGALAFWIKGEKGGELFNVGLLDDASDGVDQNVQTSLSSKPYCQVSRVWQRVVIPLADFNDFGKWWHSDAHYEVNGTVDWSRICQLRFSGDKYANAAISQGGTEPVTLHIADIRFTTTSSAFSNSRYWKSFTSNAADRVVENFNRPKADSGWSVAADSLSVVHISTVVNPGNATAALSITHSLAEWTSIYHDITDTVMGAASWSNHAGISLEVYSEFGMQTCAVMLIDSGEEAWSATFIAAKGWEKVVIPFERFRVFESWQPEGAVQNNRMDLGQVRQFSFRPGAKGKNAHLAIDDVILTNKFPTGFSRGQAILYNQIGYEKTLPKRFLFADTGVTPFALFDSRGKNVYSGKMEPGVNYALAGVNVQSGMFTGVHRNGTFSVVMQERGEKQDVVIGDTLYRQPFRAALKAFYFQRSGCALDTKYAGQWARSAGHLDTACTYHVSTGREGQANMHGGWYDAGDYGKYVVPAGITVATLLGLYELFPHCAGDSLGIPESGNGKSDLLDEVRFELDWLLRMQDSDGGVFFKIGTLAWDGFTMPDATVRERFVIGKSTSSTLAFAAVTAKAARIYKEHDGKFANNCRKAAAAAWKWAVEHPSIAEPQESGGTGTYSDSKFSDEFFFAATELYCTTGKGVYRRYVEKGAAANKVTGPAGWNDVADLGIFTLLTNEYGTHVSVQNGLRQSLISQADKTAQAIEEHPLSIPSEQFVWGSNGVMLNYAIVLCYAYKLTGKRKYLERVADVAGYIFGLNPTGCSFVTGFGDRSPLRPHHRIMGADTVDAPFPGFVVGGPNAGREDENREEPGVYYPQREPARSYVDLQGAYASNEVAINWNAALVFVVGFLAESL